MRTHQVQNELRRSIKRQMISSRRSGIAVLGESSLLVVMLIGVCWWAIHFVIHSPMELTDDERTPFLCDRAVYQIRLSDSGKLWVYQPHRGIKRYRLPGNLIEHELRNSNKTIETAGFSDDGNSVLLGYFNGDLSLHRDDDDTLYLESRDLTDAANIATLSSDGRIAVCATFNGWIRGWHFQKSLTDETPRIQPEPTIISVRLPVEGSENVVRMAVDAASERIFAVTRSSRLFIYEVGTGNLVERLLESSGALIAVAFSPDLRLAALFNTSNQLEFFSMETGRKEFAIEGLRRDAADTLGVVEYSPDGRFIGIANTFQNSIQVYDIERRSMIAFLNGHQGIVKTLQFTYGGDRLYSGSCDGTVREWSLRTRSQVRLMDFPA